ncbi:hypothetical protein ACRYKS_22685 [Escherichia coli]|uniref:hypothetical protein n=1 Tax=Escherichia coli TaxID=562 RepID=UPI003D8F5EE2
MKYTTTRSTKYKFVTNSIKVHGIRYDYSMVKYHNAKTKVWIGCAKTWIFFYKHQMTIHVAKDA